VEALFRYPVKSMGGERLEVAKLGWHGLDGDRRMFARRMAKRCLSSGRTWPRRSDAATGLPCR
jgi:uncharacterized protein YcbX